MSTHVLVNELRGDQTVQLLRAVAVPTPPPTPPPPCNPDLEAAAASMLHGEWPRVSVDGYREKLVHPSPSTASAGALYGLPASYMLVIDGQCLGTLLLLAGVAGWWCVTGSSHSGCQCSSLTQDALTPIPPKRTRRPRPPVGLFRGVWWVGSSSDIRHHSPGTPRTRIRQEANVVGRARVKTPRVCMHCRAALREPPARPVQAAHTAHTE